MIGLGLGLESSPATGLEAGRREIDCPDGLPHALRGGDGQLEQLAVAAHLDRVRVRMRVRVRVRVRAKVRARVRARARVRVRVRVRVQGCRSP